jgi:hypothetical protein
MPALNSAPPPRLTNVLFARPAPKCADVRLSVMISGAS